MLDGVSLDQLRTFIAAADEGSFSAAGRRLRRAQSVVSQTLANLEEQIDVQLFDRSSRYPRLTEQGTALLAQARLVVSGMDDFKSKARAIAQGLEPELSVVVDVMYPMASLTAAVGEFRDAFPHTPLRLYVEALGAVMRPVLEHECRLGISGSMPTVPETVDAEKLLDVPMVTVAAPAHPLASIKRVIRLRELKEHVQLVLTDRTTLTEGKTFGVLSPLIWRLADLGAKHAFLRAGFGWGHMPVPMVHDDIVSGELVPLQIENFQPQTPPIAMFAIYRKDTPPGFAGRWFLDRLKHSSSVA
ncbi:LysR family transcriptional regulator [Mycetohabitans sp. B5]|uniref:LysR family transcriptional regulator n=1 Tax=Mycetohabitans endofungorum TaxID=417203 RepID=A0A2P5KC04_9BURK|nr:MULTISPECIES: LysR family transcriptional regulator [Mycetohabitans]MCG1054521.1 LysR family transcriptional regulator [Mycetohabitans sp. B5]PPB84244.1 LysR family transcriptional regulator [Mycetohabitans endofungorum]